MTWDGAHLAVDATPGVPSPSGFLAVSCPAVALCTAVGAGGDEDETLVERTP